jgi:AcrR family transcriptional regulator
MEPRAREPAKREPVSRRGQPPRPALSRAVIIGAGLRIADGEGLHAVTMRRVAAELETSASALYVYIRGREDLLDAMFDHAMAEVADAAISGRTWRERLSSLLIRSVKAASGHGGLAEVALSRIPSGPNARKITGRVRQLLAEGQIAEAAVPGALDLLALFVTAAALDRVPTASIGSKQRQDLLRWEIDVILNGLAATRQGPPVTVP